MTTASRIADLSIQVSHALVAAAAVEAGGKPATDRAFPRSNSDHRSFIGVARDRFDAFVDAHLPVAIEDGERGLANAAARRAPSDVSC